MDDFLILLQAKLDEAKSKGNVNADIDKIQQQIDKLKIQATIDPKSTSNIVKQLEGVLNQKINISNIGIDTGQISKVGQKVGQTVADSAQKAIDGKNINVDKLNADIKNLINNLNNFSAKNAGFDTFKTDINGVEVSLDSLIGKLSTFDNSIDLDTLRSQANALKSSFAEIAKVNEIQLSLDTGETESKINALISKTNQWTDENGNARISTNSLTESLDNLGRALNEYISTPTEDKQKNLIDANKQLDIEYKKIASSVRNMNAELAKDSAVASLKLQYQNFWNDNGKYHKRFAAQFNSAMEELANSAGVPKQRIEELKRELINAQTECKRLGLTGQTWFQNFGDKIKQLGTYLTGTVIIGKTLQTGKRMVDEVYEIDTAMTNLYKVTDETEKKYTQFLDSASDSAQNLGRSISSLVEQTANWSKLGFSLDEAEQLARISSIYSNVGEVSDDTAVSDMVTAMKAFNIEASDAITIVDKLNKLGNEYATSAAALGDGLSRSASAMATSGTDINKTLAMLTGGTEITQNASEFGNFLKIGSMRIRGMKGSLEELGEEVDETVDSISKVQTQILNLTGGKVNIFDNMGNFRDYYDIMKDISEIYNDLSDPNKADLTEILFGKQRGNQGAALIQAFQSGQIQKAYEATLNAQGSAMQEQERWLGSLEAKTQQFEAAFQSLSKTVVDSDVLKEIVDFGTKGVSSFEGIVKVLEKVNSLFGLTTKNMGGLLGAVSGLIMNKNGIGERTMFQW